MLTQLTIKNYALIRHLEMRPSDHLNVITGETGAGKSIMLGAIGLLLGNRADTRVLWDESEKCVTEGIFEIKPYRLKKLFQELDLDYNDQTVVRREISPGGKSRAFINDTPVTLDVMRAVGDKLMDIHSQHETLELGNQKFQLTLIDHYAGHASLIEEYDATWQGFLSAKKAFEELSAESGKLKEEYDFIRFQLDELQKANFQSDEQESLESGLKIAEHGEDIKSRLNQLLQLLGQAEASVQSQLGEATALFQPIKNFSSAYEALSGRLESLRIELKDILNEIEHEEGEIEFDAERTKELQERLNLLYGLMQKHRVQNIAGLLELEEKFESQTQKTINLDESLAAAKRLYEEKSKQMMAVAGKLSQSRKKTFPALTRQLVSLLRDLGIPDAVLNVDARQSDPGPRGTDQVEILFSANKGIAPRPLGDVASGGEFSRVMFCVKYVMAEKAALPTLVLDEIDTGVSGEIAVQLGRMMKAMSERHQLIAISHLPQIAAKGDRHYLVYKDNSSKKAVSEIRELDKDGRVEEIAKMIGGAKPTSIARENAKELIGE